MREGEEGGQSRRDTEKFSHRWTRMNTDLKSSPSLQIDAPKVRIPIQEFADGGRLVVRPPHGSVECPNRFRRSPRATQLCDRPDTERITNQQRHDHNHAEA